MMHFYCQDCGEIFSEDNAKILWDGDGRVVTNYYACPDCRSTDIKDASVCEICGKPIPPDKHICEECLQEMNGAWNALVEKVMDIRLKADNGKSADFLDCEEGVMEFLREVGIVF